MKTLTEQLIELQKIANETTTGGDISALGLAIAIKVYNLGWSDVYDNITIDYDYEHPYIETKDVPNLI